MQKLKKNQWAMIALDWHVFGRNWHCTGSNVIYMFCLIILNIIEYDKVALSSEI